MTSPLISTSFISSPVVNEVICFKGTHFGRAGWTADLGLLQADIHPRTRLRAASLCDSLQFFRLK